MGSMGNKAWPLAPRRDGEELWFNQAHNFYSFTVCYADGARVEECTFNINPRYPKSAVAGEKKGWKKGGRAFSIERTMKRGFPAYMRLKWGGAAAKAPPLVIEYWPDVPRSACASACACAYGLGRAPGTGRMDGRETSRQTGDCALWVPWWVLRCRVRVRPDA